MKNKIFKIGEEEINVKEITLIDQMQIREDCYKDLKKENKSELKEISEMLPEKERVSFLLKALKDLTPTEAQVDEYFVSKQGILKVLSVALNTDIDKITNYVNTDWDTTLEMYKFAMGTLSDETEKNLEEATTE